MRSLDKLNDKNIKPIKVLIELPNWLGDSIMSIPAIENIINYYENIEITIIGTFSSIEVIKNNPKVVHTITSNSKTKFPFTPFKKTDFYDVYFSFRSSLRAKFLKFSVNAVEKFQFNHKNYPNRHQVEKYVDFVNKCVASNYPAGELKNYITKTKNRKTSRLVGINPGASYGNAKRWYTDQFAKVALELSDSFDIIIFGGNSEKDFANEIEYFLIKNKVSNYLNVAGKTSISELSDLISDLDIFITGDSGPMHLAASLQVPTISIFGPTNPIETSQWKNVNSIIVKKDLDCQPCLKRSCPLKHHNCMKLIEAQEVIESVSLIIKS